MRRVVVTGIGSVSPLGNSFGKSWNALKAGESGINGITRFDASHLPWKIAGELKAFDGTTCLSGKEINRLDPFVQYAVAAALMAMKDSGLIDSNHIRATGNKEERIISDDSSPVTHHSSLKSAGVIVGSSRGGITTIERALNDGQTRNRRLSPYLMPSTTIGMAASYVAQKLGMKGHCLGISNACASGTNAVGEAFRMIRSGYSRAILAGGSEAPICRLSVEGYGVAGALSRKTACSPRPFDRKRDGFVLAEGASLLLLEDYEHAVERRADIYGEIAGYGNTTDSFHMTRPDPHGEADAIRAALREAGVGPDDIDYITTHGTGTQIGDISEARAIREVFGKRASAIPATAIKSLTGHMLAASGPFEIAAALMSLKEGFIPATANLDEKEPACDVNIVSRSRQADINAAVSNSFGFGGVNAVIVLKKI